MLGLLTWTFADPAVAHNKRVRRRRRAHKRAMKAFRRHERSMSRSINRRRRWGYVVSVSKFLWNVTVVLFLALVVLGALSYSGIRTLISRVTSERSHR